MLHWRANYSDRLRVSDGRATFQPCVHVWEASGARSRGTRTFIYSDAQNAQDRARTWKSPMERISLRHLMRKAAQTYRWKWEKPSDSACKWRTHRTCGERFYFKCCEDSWSWGAKMLITCPPQPINQQASSPSKKYINNMQPAQQRF